MDLLSLHAIGFDFEIREDTMSGRVQREEATSIQLLTSSLDH